MHFPPPSQIARKLGIDTLLPPMAVNLSHGAARARFGETKAEKLSAIKIVVEIVDNVCGEIVFMSSMHPSIRFENEGHDAIFPLFGEKGLMQTGVFRHFISDGQTAMKPGQLIE